KELNIEIMRRARREQPQRIDGLAAVAGDQKVARNAIDRLPVGPRRRIAAVLVGSFDDAAVDRHRHTLIGPLDHPWRLVAKPQVRTLSLLAFDDFLFKQTVVVIDAITKAW